MLTAIDGLALTFGLSRSEAIRQLVELGLKRHPGWQKILNPKFLQGG
jgi:hypothetical protein